MNKSALPLSEASRKASFWKTAYALVGCAEFKAGDCVAVEYQFTDANGVDWFHINKTQHGPTHCTIAYPFHHLTRFCI